MEDKLKAHKAGIYFLLAFIFAFKALANDSTLIDVCPTGNICVNNTPSQNTSYLTDGESLTFNTTLKAEAKGLYLFKGQGNSTANGTSVYSSSSYIEVFAKSHIIPMCNNLPESEPFCNNNTYWNQTYLTDGESFVYSVDVYIPKDAPVPSNWTFFAFGNSTANGTEVESHKINIEISEIISEITFSVTINSPLNQSYSNDSILFDIDTIGSNLKDCWYSLNNGSGNVSYTCNSTFQLSVGEGSYNFIAYANQTNSSIALDTINFNVDKTPIWHYNSTSQLSGLEYNPLISYEFSMNYTDTYSGIQNITISFNGTNTTFSFTDDRKEANATLLFNTLSAANYTYYWQGCDRVNCNFSDIYKFEVRKSSTTSYAYIDGIRTNNTYIYSPSEHTILSNWTSNLTALLYLDGVSIPNGTDTIFGVGLFNLTVINEGSVNYTGSTETWWVRVNKADTLTYLYIDNVTQNLTKTYGLNVNISTYNTNSTLILYINNVTTLNNSVNGFIGLLGVGYYNVTAYSLGNTNYTSSYQGIWLTITQKSTSIMMTANGTRGNYNTMADKVINFTVTLFDENNTLLTNTVNFWNNFSGTWVNHSKGSSAYTNNSNVTGFSSNSYLFGGRFDGNVNYSVSAENWTLQVVGFNLTYNFSCGISSFTYNETITYVNGSGRIYNMTLTLVNGTGSSTNLKDFYYVYLTNIYVSNATSGLPVSSGNWSIKNDKIYGKFNTSYNNMLINLTARYYYKVFFNNTQKKIAPRWQNDSCGIYNFTLNDVGTNIDNGTLKAVLINPNNFSMNNITVKIGNNFNYTVAITLNNLSYVPIMNMTKGNSNMTWHWLDFNFSKPGVTLFHNIDFKMFIIGE